MNEILRIKKANAAAEVAKTAEANEASQSPIESTPALLKWQTVAYHIRQIFRFQYLRDRYL